LTDLDLFVAVHGPAAAKVDLFAGVDSLRAHVVEWSVIHRN